MNKEKKGVWFDTGVFIWCSLVSIVFYWLMIRLCVTVFEAWVVMIVTCLLFLFGFIPERFIEKMEGE